MGKVQKSLVASVGMCRSHEPFFNSEVIQKDLADRGKTIGCAGCIGDYMVLLRIVFLMVYTHDNRQIRALGRGGYDHLFGPRFKMGGGLGPVRKKAGAFEDKLGTHVAPRGSLKGPFRYRP